ncbi:MAG: ABC transporter ATP-binding protein [Victivallis sp.]
MTSVEIKGITKSYQPGVPVLKPIDLAIKPGELFFLLGPSGCGKSTLLRILAGLVEPDSGSIRFNDVEITRLPPEKRRAAMVFQNYALWPHLSVFENVAFGLRAAGEKKAEIEREVQTALELVRMDGYAGRKIPSLSGGQQQRVALARALAVKPALLLLDEPLSNLDARLRDTMRREIRRICKERKLTAIYVTHDRKEALSMADRLAVMDQGVIRQIDTPEKAYNAPREKFVASFLGDANFIGGQIDSAGRWQTAFGPLDADGISGTPGETVTAMIRPERIRFSDAPGNNVIEARLTGRSFTGESCEWEFEAAGKIHRDRKRSSGADARPELPAPFSGRPPDPDAVKRGRSCSRRSWLPRCRFSFCWPSRFSCARPPEPQAMLRPKSS